MFFSCCTKSAELPLFKVTVGVLKRCKMRKHTEMFRITEYVISAKTEFDAYELAKDKEQDMFECLELVMGPTIDNRSTDIIYKKVHMRKIAPTSDSCEPEIIMFVRLK